MSAMTDQRPDEPADPTNDVIFREIAELAAQLCGAAYAAITLHDRLRHRALAIFGGIDLGVLPRDSRFCCEVLHSGAPLEVSDAAFDVRFHDDPLVAGGPRIASIRACRCWRATGAPSAR